MDDGLLLAFALSLALLPSMHAGSVSFSTPPPISTAADGASFVAVGDLDGDGGLDVLSASEQGDTVAWYRNETTRGRTLYLPIAIGRTAGTGAK